MFAIGDTVRATAYIRRVDWQCSLRIGELAEVISVVKGSREGVEIVAVKLQDGNQMIDIVCENIKPFEK